MIPDELQAAWQAEPTPVLLTPDLDQLLREVRRDQGRFARMILWRDVREVGVAVIMIPLWIVLGVRHSLPWTWYLMVPALLWVTGFLLWHRVSGRRLGSGPGDSLHRQLAASLADVERQIWLLRGVPWWYITPPSLAGFAFIGQIAIRERSDGWLWLVAPLMVAAIFVAVMGFVAWINQYAVRTGLEPRRRELAAQLAGLADESPDSGQPEPPLDPR